MKISNIIIGIIIALTLSSCGAEFELAKKFVNQSNQINVAVYFPEDAQVTLELEPEKEYDVCISGKDSGVMKTNLGGKLNISVELNVGEPVAISITAK